MRTWPLDLPIYRKNQFVVLDIFNRMYRNLDENSVKDMGAVIEVLEFLTAEVGLAILALDHAPKPGPRGGYQRPGDIRGSSVKFGAADYALSATKKGSDQIRIDAVGKDIEQQRLLIQVSPIGSKEPKLTLVDSGQTGGQKKKPDKTLTDVLKMVGSNWTAPSQIQARTGLPISTLRRQLKKLVDRAYLEKTGQTKSTQYRFTASGKKALKS